MGRWGEVGNTSPPPHLRGFPPFCLILARFGEGLEFAEDVLREGEHVINGLFGAGVINSAKDYWMQNYSWSPPVAYRTMPWGTLAPTQKALALKAAIGRTTRRGPRGRRDQLRRIPRAPRIEIHWFDVDNTTQALNTSGTVTFLNNVPIGTEGSQRTGDSIRLISLECYINIAKTGNAGAAGGENMRFLIVYDKQPVPGSTPSISAILENSTGTTTAKGWKNLDNRDRFVILRDFRWSVVSSLAATASLLCVQGLPEATPTNVHPYIKLKGIPTIFERGAANIHTGAIYAVSLGDVASGTECFTSAITSRLRFTDA